MERFIYINVQNNTAMDPISHYMLAWLLGRKLNLEKRVFRVFLLSSLIPDIDVLFLLLGTDSVLKYHGTFTHSVFVVPVLAVLIALAMGPDFRTAIPYALFGGYLHVIIDSLINTAIVFKAGNPCLWPVSDAKCLLVYNVPPLAEEVMALKILLTAVLYGLGIYYIKKKDYPWKVWMGN